MTAGGGVNSICIVGGGGYQFNVEEQSLNTIISNLDIDEAKPVMGAAMNQKDGSVTVLVRDIETEEDILYSFRKQDLDSGKNTNEKSAEKITIYSLKETNNIRQAAERFQELHQGVEVEIQIGYSGEDSVTLSDAVRKLNTEVLAGEGPDLMVLDSLPIDKYVEKGVLEDISEIVNKNSKLFQNMIQNINPKGHIYVVPTSFSIPILLGDNEVVKSSNTEKLLETIQEKKTSDIPVIKAENFPSAALYLFTTSTTEIFSKDGMIDQKELSKFYEELKAIADLVLAEKTNEERIQYYSLKEVTESYPSISGDGGSSIYFDKAQMEIGLIPVADVYAGIQSVCKAKELEFTNLNKQYGNMYIPQNMLGVNSVGKNIELSKEFLRYFLSEEYQNSNSTGFSINEESSKLNFPQSETGELYNKYYEDKEGTNELNIPKLTSKEVEEFTDFVKELDVPVLVDMQVLQTVMEQAEEFLYEGKSLEDAVHTVSEKVDIYLAE